MSAEMVRKLSDEQMRRLGELTHGTFTYDERYSGLSERQAVEAEMLITGVDEFEARQRVAIARGEDPSDVIAVP